MEWQTFPMSWVPGQNTPVSLKPAIKCFISEVSHHLPSQPLNYGQIHKPQGDQEV